MQMKILFYLLFFMAGMSAIGQNKLAAKTFPEKVRSLKNPYTNEPTVLKRGTKIYQKSCWNCHGDNGIGNGPQSKEINTKVADFNDNLVKGRTDGELFWWIQSGGNDMQAFKELLAEEDIWSVVLYVRKVQNKLPQ